MVQLCSTGSFDHGGQASPQNQHLNHRLQGEGQGIQVLGLDVSAQDSRSVLEILLEQQAEIGGMMWNVSWAALDLDVTIRLMGRAALKNCLFTLAEVRPPSDSPQKCPFNGEAAGIKC